MAVLITGLLVVFLLPHPTPAATLRELDLVIDGSVAPPGDRLDLAVLLLPGEKEVTLEIRAFLVSGEQNSQVQPVKAAGRRNRDPGGNFLAAVRCQRGPTSPLILKQVTIPYADLGLPNGVHRIAYEVTGLCGEQVAFVRATELTRVTVSDRVREEMEQRVVDQQPTVRKRKVTAILPGEVIRGGIRTVEEASIEITTTAPATVTSTRKVAVAIPGGFERREITPRVEPPTVDQTPEEALRDALEGKPWSPLSAIRSERDRVVYFATNRAKRKPPQEEAKPEGQPGNDQEAASPTDEAETPPVEPAAENGAGDEGEAEPEADGPPRFGPDVADEITYGACVVNIPVQNHKRGKLEQPGWWQQRDPAKHFGVELVEVLGKEQFIREVRRGDILLFVHGFNNTFEAAVLRTAQLQYDLEFPGPAVSFSWPSVGAVNEYELDGQHASESTAALAEVFRVLIGSPGDSPGGEARTQRIHVIAHSMGNRVLLGAVYELYRTGDLKPDTRPLGQVMLAAPDVGALMFNNLIPYVIEFSDQVTYYYCNRDAALAMSQEINKYEPVGLLPFFEDGLNTVNADDVDTSFFFHNYYASARQVLADVQLMVKFGLKPQERMPPLASRSEIFGHCHWSFTPMEVRGSVATTDP